MKRPTIAELQAKIRALEPYQELFYCRREKPIVLKSGDHKVKLVGASRASGGVVIVGPSDSVSFACEWCQRIETQYFRDPYLRDLAAQIRRLQKEAVQKRLG